MDNWINGGYVQLSVSFQSRPNLSGYIVANIFNT